MESFWNKVEKRGPLECWPWRGRVDRQGYGQFRWRLSGREVQMQASRYALLISSAPASGSLFCCHHCDNPTCCNPAHLYWGDAKMNAQDRVRRNRSNRKAQPGVADEARRMISVGHSIAHVSRILGVTRKAVISATRKANPRKWVRKSPSSPPAPPLAPP